MKSGRDKALVVFMGRYNESESLSGPEKTAVRISGFHSEQNRSAFIQYYFDGKKYGFLKKMFGMEIRPINNKAALYTAGIFRIIPLLIKLNPDIIHIITYERFAIIALLVRFFSRVKIVYNEHGIIAYENTEIKKVPFAYRVKDKFCEWSLLKFSDRVIFYSERSLDIAQKYFRINESKVIILSNGIDEAFHDSFTGRNSSKADCLKAVILNISKFSLSGVEFLKKAQVDSELPIDLFVVGDKIDFGSSSELNMHNSKKMSTSEIAKFYEDKDVFLSLNSYDTFSIAAVEAMASGLIPVVTEETGMSRYIINGENGYTVKYGDSNAFVDIIESLSANREKCMELKSESAKIYGVLSWHEVYCSYESLYESLYS